MADPQPITLYSHTRAPNPWKVALILEELGVPYQTKYLEFPETKQEPYLSLNPNGKLPAIEDPNHHVTLFESGAIIEYLVDLYDSKSILTPSSLQDKYRARSWLHLQMSAQGPSCGYKLRMGQVYDAKELVAANDYLSKDIKRLMGVLDTHLRQSGGPYLLGPQVSYADLCYVPLYSMLPVFLPDYDVETQSDFPHFAAWWTKVVERPAVTKVMETRAALAKSLTGDDE
ncbi:glutathione-s-transferase [Penicillium longicatenatum]|uniref:glutathione-s-transferase n=1 Tax=Penicillium longicatenatum TaxID=1561947 RepID=UPI002546C016|nr:glutathione-s-transferase [Penicillium longicatenatum]KAJ5658156.1 glutathione-s-transferase [Penicillium longicatenatum]